MATSVLLCVCRPSGRRGSKALAKCIAAEKETLLRLNEDFLAQMFDYENMSEKGYKEK